MPKTRAFQLLDYTGIDINRKLIDTHSAKYTTQKFLCLDAIVDELPNADVAIIRDVIFHLSHADTFKLLTKARSHYKWCFITSCTNLRNSDTFDLYHYHETNLFIRPFHFEHYLDRMWETGHNRFVYLFAADQIKISQQHGWLRTLMSR
jgi:hypothetical protein